MSAPRGKQKCVAGGKDDFVPQKLQTVLWKNKDLACTQQSFLVDPTGGRHHASQRLISPGIHLRPPFPPEQRWIHCRNAFGRKELHFCLAAPDQILSGMDYTEPNQETQRSSALARYIQTWRSATAASTIQQVAVPEIKYNIALFGCQSSSKEPFTLSTAESKMWEVLPRMQVKMWLQNCTLATSPLAAHKKGQGHSCSEPRGVESPPLSATCETNPITTTVIRKPHVYNQICCPSQSCGLTKISIKWAFGKPSTSYKWGSTYPSGAAAIARAWATTWKVVSQFLISVLSQVPLSPKHNHLERRKDSHKLGFSSQSDPSGVHSFSTLVLFHMVFTRTTSDFKDGLHTLRNVFLTKVDRSFLQALLFLWPSHLHSFSQLFLFLCRLRFNRSIMLKCIPPRSPGLSGGYNTPHHGISTRFYEVWKYPEASLRGNTLLHFLLLRKRYCLALPRIQKK